MKSPISQSVTIGQVFVFRALLQGVVSGIQEIAEISIFAYDLDQAIDNFQRAYPQMEPWLDEMRLRKAVGEYPRGTNV